MIRSKNLIFYVTWIRKSVNIFSRSVSKCYLNPKNCLFPPSLYPNVTWIQRTVYMLRVCIQKLPESKEPFKYNPSQSPMLLEYKEPFKYNPSLYPDVTWIQRTVFILCRSVSEGDLNPKNCLYAPGLYPNFTWIQRNVYTLQVCIQMLPESQEPFISSEYVSKCYLNPKNRLYPPAPSLSSNVTWIQRTVYMLRVYQ